LETVYNIDKAFNAISITFNLEDIYININTDLDIIKSLILGKIDRNTLYTVYIRVRYNKDSYLMAGNQFGFTYSTDADLVDLVGVLVDRLEQLLVKYTLDLDQIVYIQPVFRKVSRKIVTEFSRNERKGVFNVHENTFSFISCKACGFSPTFGLHSSLMQKAMFLAISSK